MTKIKKTFNFSAMMFLLAAGCSPLVATTDDPVTNPGIETPGVENPGTEIPDTEEPGTGGSSCIECGQDHSYVLTVADRLVRIHDDLHVPGEVVDQNGSILGQLHVDGIDYLCSMKDSTAQFRYEIDGTLRTVSIGWEDGKINSLKYISEEGSLEDEPTWTDLTDHPLIGAPAPLSYEVPLRDVIGQLNSTFVVDKDGVPQVQVDSIATLLQTIQEALGENHGEIKTAIEGSVKTINDAFVEKIETVFNESTFDKTNDLINDSREKICACIKHYVGQHNDKIRFSVQKIVSKILTELEAVSKQISTELSAMTGIKLSEDGTPDSGTLLAQLNTTVQNVLDKIGLTPDMIQTIQLISQIINDQGQLPSYYAGSIEHMMFGYSRMMAPNDETLCLSTMLKKFPAFYDLAGLEDQKSTLMSIASQLETILKFVIGTDIPTFNVMLPYLIQLFGDQFPIYDVAEEKISKYCASAEFSVKDYGLFAWFSSLYNELSELNALKDEVGYSSALQTTLANLDLLLRGVVQTTDSEYSPFPENHLGNNLMSYLDILPDCIERINRISKYVPSLVLSEKINTLETYTKETLGDLTEKVHHMLCLVHKIDQALMRS